MNAFDLVVTGGKSLAELWAKGLARIIAAATTGLDTGGDLSVRQSDW